MTCAPEPCGHRTTLYEFAFKEERIGEALLERSSSPNPSSRTSSFCRNFHFPEEEMKIPAKY
jgi:hypothetical protein